MSKMAIMRFQTLSTQSRGRGSVGQSLRHLDEHEHSADISRPELSGQNHSFVSRPPTYRQLKEVAQKYADRHNKAVDEWNETHDKPKRRHLKKGAAQFFEGVFSYSPEMEGVIPYQEWAKATIEFIKREFVAKGCKVARLELHRDEKTTHIQFVALAWNEKEQNCSVRSVLGSNKELCELQDRYAEAMKPFELERGFSRYRAYESVRKKAVAAGYGDDVKSVARYAKDNDIEIPRYRGHKPIAQWKAEQNEIGIELEHQNDVLAQSVDDLTKIKAELSALIPETYCDVVNRAESYAKLLKIGKDIKISVGETEISMTDYLTTLSERGRNLAKGLGQDR